MSETSAPFVYPVALGPHVIAPEYYRSQGIEALAVDQVVYPTGQAFAIDATTRRIYVSTQGYLLSSDVVDPPYFGQRAGVMRLAPSRARGGAHAIVSGYVADLRELTANHIRVVHISDDDPHSRQYVQAENARNAWAPLDAAVILDPDGNEQFLGNWLLQDCVAYVMQQVDAVKINLSGAGYIARHSA